MLFEHLEHQRLVAVPTIAHDVHDGLDGEADDDGEEDEQDKFHGGSPY